LGHVHFFSALRADKGFSTTQMLWFQNWGEGLEADWKQGFSTHVVSRERFGVSGRRLFVPFEAIQQ